ncbi:hypothetical protein, partial [Frankia sp. Cr1]|uniref:hypothetical protein n=1 Tax=Frankia sp. Cr1 TaxID=3073931 RepID=UPI002AD4F0A2
MTKPLPDSHDAGMRGSPQVPGLRGPGGFVGALDDPLVAADRDDRFWAVGRSEIVAGVVGAVAMAAAGLPLGLLWAAAAPRLDVRAALAGSELAFDAQAGVDVYFAMICGIGGLVAGALAFWRGRSGGWPLPVGLALGGLTGSLLASWIGHELRSSRVTSQLPDGARDLAVQLVDFRLRSSGFLVVLPAVSLFVLAVLTWFSTFRMPRRPLTDPT